MASWIPAIAYIQDLIDKVRATDANRPLAQLDQRTQYLYDALQAIASGELLSVKNVTLDSATVPGTPVYFDEAANTFKPGIAEIDIGAGSDYGFATPRAVIRGIVLVKHGPAAGDVALVGRIKASVWGIDWTQVIDTGTITAGIHYLAASEAGKMSRSRSHLSVYLGSLNSGGDFILNPVINGNLRDHLHYRFDLVSTVVPDTSAEGWAPVSEFPEYPVGATHGYVIPQNAELQANFPPVPLDACTLEFQGRGVHKDAYIVDENGIWWMSPTPPDALAPDINFPTPAFDQYYTLWVTKLNFGAPFVSTLEGLDEADTVPVLFKDINGNSATSGVLRACIEQFVKIQAGLDEGGTALKSFTGIKAQMGPVLSRLFPGSGVSLDGDFGDDTQGWYGRVTVSSGASSEINGSPELVAMDNAVEDFYGNLPVLAFPELRVSSMRLKVNVPLALPASRSMKLILDLIGIAGGSISLNLSYILIRPGVGISQTEIPLTPLSPTLIANQVVRVSSDLIQILPGDTVYYKITQPNAGLATAIPVVRMQYGIVRTP